MKKIVLSLFFLIAFVACFPALLPAAEKVTPPDPQKSTETAEEETGAAAKKDAPLNKVVNKVNRGTETLIDRTIKGAYKVATLGMSDLESYEVQEPEKGSGEPTKFKISIPGT